jgi:hypothetical protein
MKSSIVIEVVEGDVEIVCCDELVGAAVAAAGGFVEC